MEATAASRYETLLPKTAAVDCFSKRRLVILLSDFVYWQIRVGIWLMGLILGYRPFVAKKNSLALSCHTNGMGHVIQMLRIIDVLNAAQIPVGLIVLASKGKIPAHFLASLREKAGPDAEIVDLDHEVHYDDNNGAKINNLRVVLEAGWKIFGPEGWRTVKQCIGLLMKHRPEVCLSLWDPHLPIMIDAFSCPTHNLQVATQAIMYEAGRGQDLVLDMLYLLNVGLKGELLPLVFSPQPGAMPIVCEVPPLLPAEPYIVAYSCMPQVLTPIAQVTKHKILLFAKNVDKWTLHYKDCPNVTVEAVGAKFQLALAKCSGLIASPSPGVVIQALACAKPCYLFIPSGHLEQTCNYEYYGKHFIGVSSPLLEPIDTWADSLLEQGWAAKSATRPANAAANCLPLASNPPPKSTVGGGTVDANPMLTQAHHIREWLNSFEDAAHRTLIRSLRRLHGEGDGSGKVGGAAWPAAAVSAAANV